MPLRTDTVALRWRSRDALQEASRDCASGLASMADRPDDVRRARTDLARERLLVRAAAYASSLRKTGVREGDILPEVQRAVATIGTDKESLRVRATVRQWCAGADIAHLQDVSSAP